MVILPQFGADKFSGFTRSTGNCADIDSCAGIIHIALLECNGRQRIMGREFFITDVFYEGDFGGNQLATVTQAEGLSGKDMQNIAREFNFSETTFLLGGNSEQGFDVRIFTPKDELPFAGHPTLGTAFIIREFVGKQDLDRVELNLGVGKIPVTFADDGVLWMKQQSPAFGDAIPRDQVAQSLGLQLSDIHEDYPSRFVSTGLEFLLVPLTSMAALKQCELIKAFGLGTFVFTPGGYISAQSISARMFAGGAGITEDPATGSANGCLASYLVEHEFLGVSEIDIQVGQGYEINRASTLYLRASKQAGEFDINVGGRVSLFARGELLV